MGDEKMGMNCRWGHRAMGYEKPWVEAVDGG